MYDFVNILVEKMEHLYPENREINGVKSENYFHQNDMVNYVTTREEIMKKLNAEQDLSNWFNSVISIYYHSGKIDDDPKVCTYPWCRKHTVQLSIKNPESQNNGPGNRWMGRAEWTTNNEHR